MANLKKISDELVKIPKSERDVWELHEAVVEILKNRRRELNQALVKGRKKGLSKSDIPDFSQSQWKRVHRNLAALVQSDPKMYADVMQRILDDKLDPTQASAAFRNFMDKLEAVEKAKSPIDPITGIPNIRAAHHIDTPLNTVSAPLIMAPLQDRWEYQKLAKAKGWNVGELVGLNALSHNLKETKNLAELGFPKLTIEDKKLIAPGTAHPPQLGGTGGKALSPDIKGPQNIINAVEPQVEAFKAANQNAQRLSDIFEDTSLTPAKRIAKAKNTMKIAKWVTAGGVLLPSLAGGIANAADVYSRDQIAKETGKGIDKLQANLSKASLALTPVGLDTVPELANLGIDLGRAAMNPAKIRGRSGAGTGGGAMQKKATERARMRKVEEDQLDLILNGF